MKKSLYLIAMCLIINFCLPNLQAAFPKTYDFDFDNVRMQELVSAVATVCHAHFIIDSQDEILISWVQKGVSENAVLGTFIEIVRASGYMVTSLSPGLYRIHDTTVKVTGTSQGVGVFPLQNIEASEVVEALGSIYGEKVASAPAGTKVVVTGPASLLKECSILVKQLNEPGTFQVHRIPIQYVSVRSVVQSLIASQIVPETAFFADPWQRSIVFQGTPSDFNRFKLAVAALDIPQAGTANRLVYVHSLSPETIIPVVSALVQPVSIHQVAENRVVLSGPALEVSKAENLLHEMDGSDYQVRVEAVVAYLTESEYDEIGAKLAYTGSKASAALNGGLPASLLSGSSGLLLDWFTGSFGLTASAQKGNGHGRIISSPVLFCGNGQSAKIAVGQNVPFVTNYNLDEDGNRTGTDISREDIGVSLVVTPVIERQGDFVRLQISQEVSSVAPESELSQTAVDIITDQQLIESVVTVGNGETIILGGSKREEFGESKTFVPVLGQLLGWIPGLDNLLSYKNTTQETLHLVVSIRVAVVERKA